MEDALVLLQEDVASGQEYVLILVLMEDALVPRTIKVYHLAVIVLILVLMEDALVQQNYSNALFKCIVRLNCAS